MKGVAERRIRGAIVGGCEDNKVGWFWVWGENRIQLGGRAGYKLGVWRARLKGDVDLVECAGAACIGAWGHLVGESALTRLRDVTTIQGFSGV